MKILMIAPTPFFNDRGCHVRILEESRALARAGHEVKIVTYHLGATPEGLDVERILSIPWYRKLSAGPSWHKLYLDLLLLIKAIAVNIRFRADVVHGHLHEGCLIGWFIKRLFGIPLVFDFQGSMLEEVESYDFITQGGFFARIFYLAEQAISRLPDRILVAASASRTLLTERFDIAQEHIGLLLDGIGIPEETGDGLAGSTLRAKLGIPQNALVVGYIGSLTEIEGIATMLKALSFVAAQHPRAFFYIGGYPNVDAYRRKAAELGLAERSLFPGRIPYGELMQHLKVCDILVSAKGQTEANAKLCVYMAASRPVVAFDHAINREILGYLGLYPRGTTPEALAETILAVCKLSDGERRARGEALKARAAAEFSWDARIGELTREYQALLQKSVSAKRTYRLRDHWAALLLAAGIGLLCVAPQLYFSHTPGYRGIIMTGTDGEEHYLARIEAAREGYASFGNVFLQPKNEPNFAPGLGEYITSAAGLLFGLSAAGSEFFGKFLFPFLASLLLYALAFALFRARAAALIGTAAALIGDNLVSGISAWIALARGTSAATGFLTYARPINPEVSGLFLFGGLWLLYDIFWRERTQVSSWLETALLGVVAGAALYNSIYVSSFLLMALVLIFFASLLRRNWRRAIRATVAGAVAIVCVIPFGINYLRLRAHPLYGESALRQGLIATHAPVLSLWVVIMLTAVLFFWPRRLRGARPLFSTSALALLLLLNQQIVTGHALQLSHYHWYITKPLIGLMLGMYAVFLVECFVKDRKPHRCAYALALLLLLYNAAAVQVHSYHAHYAEALAAQSYAPVLAYLNALPAGESVFADRELSLYIPIYTRQNAPNNDYAQYYLVPQQYLVDRMLLEYKLRGIPPAQIFATMQADRVDIAMRLFGVYWRDQKGSYSAIPDSLLAQYAAQYPAVYHEPLVKAFTDLGAPIIVWDRQAEPQWQLGKEAGLREVYLQGIFFVFKTY